MLLAALAVAILVQLALVARAFDGREVPAWAAIAPPLLVFVAARHELVGITTEAGLADVAVRTAPLGGLLVLFGVAGLVAGVLPALLRRPGAPALAQIGALAIGAGIVWTPWLEGYAALWGSCTAPALCEPSAVMTVREMATEQVGRAGLVAAVALGALWAPVALWGYRRDGWKGLGEGAAAFVLVAITLSTGKPAERSVDQVTRSWEVSCESASPAVFGSHPVVRQVHCSGAGSAVTLRR